MRVLKEGGVSLTENEQALVDRRDKVLAAYDVSTESAARLVLRDTRTPSRQFVEWFSGHTLTVIDGAVVTREAEPAA